MNFKTRLAKLEKWLARRCRAVKVLEITSMDNVYSSQTWVNVLVVVIEATHASLRTIYAYLGQREGTQVALQKGSVLAFSHVINQCQSLTHLSLCFLEGHSLGALGLAALPQSLQRLELLCAPGHLPGACPFGGSEVRVLDLAVLHGLPHLASVRLGPRFPLTCFVPAGLSRLTELDINSWKGLVFEEGVRMPGLQRLALVLDGSGNHVQLPTLQGLPGLTELCISPRVLVPGDLTPLRFLRSFYLLAAGVQALTWTPVLPAVLPKSLTLLQSTGRLQAFPEQALALRQLACLHLYDNCFSALPVGVTALSKLKYLSLGFPEDLHPMTMTRCAFWMLSPLATCQPFPACWPSHSATAKSHFRTTLVCATTRACTECTLSARSRVGGRVLRLSWHCTGSCKGQGTGVWSAIWSARRSGSG
jgi:hypothetical protein